MKFSFFSSCRLQKLATYLVELLQDHYSASKLVVKSSKIDIGTLLHSKRALLLRAVLLQMLALFIKS